MSVPLVVGGRAQPSLSSFLSQDDCRVGANGVQGGDDVALVLTNATGAFANKNVAVGKVVYINGLTLSGADAAKYLITQTVTKGAAIKVPVESVLTFQLDKPLRVTAVQ